MYQREKKDRGVYKLISLVIELGMAKQVETGFVISPCILPNLANSLRATVFVKTKRQTSFSCPNQLSLTVRGIEKILERINLANPYTQKF